MFRKKNQEDNKKIKLFKKKVGLLKKQRKVWEEELKEKYERGEVLQIDNGVDNKEFFKKIMEGINDEPSK